LGKPLEWYEFNIQYWPRQGNLAYGDMVDAISRAPGLKIAYLEALLKMQTYSGSVLAMQLKDVQTFDQAGNWGALETVFPPYDSPRWLAIQQWNEEETASTILMGARAM